MQWFWKWDCITRPFDRGKVMGECFYNEFIDY